MARSQAGGHWLSTASAGGAGGIRNDVAVVAAPGREPIIVVIFTERNDPDVDYDDALVAGVAGWCSTRRSSSKAPVGCSCGTTKPALDDMATVFAWTTSPSSRELVAHSGERAARTFLD